MKTITIVWLAFTIIFSSLSIYHYRASLTEIPQFNITERPYKNTTMVSLQGMSPDKPLNDFAADFNRYLKEQNKANKTQNIASSIGYLIAAITCLLSAGFSFAMVKKHIRTLASYAQNYQQN